MHTISIFCGLQKLNTLNLCHSHPPLNPRNHFSTVLIKTNWYTISCKYRPCTGLTSITIPNSVTSLGDHCFRGCWGLTNIKMKSSTPPSAGSEVFGYCTNLTTVYVPKGAKEAYNVVPWNSYEIVEMENTSIAAAPTVDSQKASAPVYGLNGRRIGTADAIAALPKGVYIVNGKKVMK